MGCCNSSEESEDRTPLSIDNGASAPVQNQAGVPAEAVARLKKSFEDAEAEETARKNSLLAKKEQQDKGILC